MQQHHSLQPTGTLTAGNTVSLLGRRITSLAGSYNKTLLEEANMENCMPAAAPGTAALKTRTADHEDMVQAEAWYNNARNNTAQEASGQQITHWNYITDEFVDATTSWTRTTEEDTNTTQDADGQQTSHWNYITDKLFGITTSWTRTTEEHSNSTQDAGGQHLEATFSFSDRMQATTSAEAEPLAINAGTAGALHVQNLLTDSLNKTKANIKVHDSSSGASIGKRIGTGKKTKHVSLKRLFIQQIVALNHLRIIKIQIDNNPADIFTKHVAAETLQFRLHSVGLHVQRNPHSSF